jgi:predicted GIY-YIG superfamily endonuclease
VSDGPPVWWVYILECGDGTLYTGVTTDLARRLAAHRAGRGARYTRGRGRLRLRWSAAAASHGEALQREAAIKRLPRVDKLALCAARKTGRRGDGEQFGSGLRRRVRSAQRARGETK